MKHLVKINELFKSTYKSAADQLKYGHQTRSKNIMGHAEEKGESDLKKDHIERQWPHKFTFNNEPLQDIKQELLGSFVIISSEKKTGLREGYEGVHIDMMNDWGQKVRLSIGWGLDGFFKFQIYYHFDSGKYIQERAFKFNNRKDALQLRRYLIEVYDADELKIRKDPRDLSINSLYTTD